MVPLWVTVPFRFKVNPSATVIELLVATPMVPVQVLAPAALRSAPLPENPVPFSVRGSAYARPFCRDSVAPLSTVVPPTAVPNAVALPRTRIPCCTVVSPAYVLPPDSVSVPLPVLVSPSVPVPVSWRVPPKLLVWSFNPTVSVRAPDPEWSTEPEPLSPLMRSLPPDRSRVPFTTTLPLPGPSGIWFALLVTGAEVLMSSVPALMIVSPA